MGRGLMFSEGCSIVSSFIMRIISILSILLLSSSLAWAEAKIEPIYVVDIQKVIDESIAGKAAKNNVELDAKKGQAKLNLLKNELEKLDEEIKRQSGILSEDALEQKRQAASRKERELALALQEQRTTFLKKNDAEIQKIIKEIKTIINSLAEKEKFKFVIEKDHRFVLYAGNDHDLTKQVIEILNEKQINS